ncbi:MAG: hypothetical protein M9951_17255 [Burkholderiaceae bacterium]|nr:hypothetical protein [Burkholderiaceae bacterium]
MRAADDRVGTINEELRKRPTSTGVRYRLKWEPLSADDGAPAGFDIARERLLNTSADLWSAEDRRAVGTMLQERITAERARADADTGTATLRNSSHGRWTIGTGTASPCNASRMDSGAVSPARPPAVNARWA